MSKFRKLAGTAVMVAALLGGAACDSDSPSESGSAPVISQLQVQGALRVDGERGVVGFSFSYADPDADIDRFNFRVEGEGSATNELSGADQVSGVAGVQQAVDLPAAGTEVQFSVFVIDRGGNRSNTLVGTFTAP